MIQTCRHGHLVVRAMSTRVQPANAEITDIWFLCHGFSEQGSLAGRNVVNIRIRDATLSARAVSGRCGELDE